ncbi:YkoP family protein [Alicyclobacillus ferrooxydans]|uniref:YkoP-like domain-containing protein n=1 Tax=Alicyclobacillus ferrooxydans TaxID=471514 RepID=A0A0N8PPX7_9BACL|nr:hypothetical protein [Alicyclobacillus ferrooxydans]KPV45557.1 hypothetical protein AN477_01050 [Alicyclobacillus ferrooxydans]
MAGETYRKLWMAWERVFNVAAHVQNLSDDGEEYLFHVAKRRYMGHPFTVDGVEVHAFDPVIELHMNNELLAQILSQETSMVRVAVKLIAEAKRSFPALVKHVSSEEYEREQVLYGTTFIHRSVERFGFSTFPFYWRWSEIIFTRYLQLVFRAVNPRAADLLKNHADTFVPRVVAISKQKLVQLHAPDGTGAAKS